MDPRGKRSSTVSLKERKGTAECLDRLEALFYTRIAEFKEDV